MESVNEGVDISKIKMICPKHKTCTKQVMWDKPNGVINRMMTTVKVKQGHCKPHYEMATCHTESKKCPKCVEYKKGE